MVARGTSCHNKRRVRGEAVGARRARDIIVHGLASRPRARAHFHAYLHANNINVERPRGRRSHIHTRDLK